MIRPADLSIPVTPLLPRTLPLALPGAGEPLRAAATWWTDAGVPQGTTIVAGLGPEARGLGVEQHAERVLIHLLSGGDGV